MRWPFVTKRTATTYGKRQYDRGKLSVQDNSARLADCVERAEEKIDAVWKLHHPPYPQNTTGVDAYHNWYCPNCRTTWPCATVQAIKGMEFEPLKLVKKS